MKKWRAVITAAGLGTRLLPVTKETPKEMLPLFVKDSRGNLCLKPLLQIVFEQLYDFGVREFCFIVGREKRSIEDHFTPDLSFIEVLRKKHKNVFADDLLKFYSMIIDSDITWKNQLSPQGFGEAVLLAKNFVGSQPFLVHAGDTFIMSENHAYLRRLAQIHNKKQAEAFVLCERDRHPEKYGVIVGEEVKEGIYRVGEIVEKPETPPTNLVAVAVYLFNPVIFDALEKTTFVAGERELTHAIQRLVEEGRKVYALELGENEARLDIGTSETYKTSLDESYEWATS